MGLWLFRSRKLASLSGAELLDIFSAQWALICAQVLVWVRPEGQLVAPGRQTFPANQPDNWEVTAQRLSAAINRTARHGLFRPMCLVRSVALHRMLEARGLTGSEICVGVRQQHGRFTAHAWVRYRGVILGESGRHVRTFTPLTDVRVVSPR
jgi:hypothetical protein